MCICMYVQPLYKQQFNVSCLTLYNSHLRITAKMPFPNSGCYRGVLLYTQFYCTITDGQINFNSYSQLVLLAPTYY